MKQDNKEHKTDDKILILSAHTVSRRTNTEIEEAECFRIYLHLLGSA
jgi:4-hydroxy-3-methylbut-2-enyl diphosphate reductase IspH